MWFVIKNDYSSTVLWFKTEKEMLIWITNNFGCYKHYGYNV